MKTYKKICLGLFIGAVSVTALCYGALITIPNTVDLNKYKESVASEIEKQTGFKVVCEDISFKRSYIPVLKINLHHTIVLYPDNEVFLKLKDADINIKLIPLFFKQIVIEDAKLTRPIINVILYKDFTTSIEKYVNPQKKLSTNGFNLDSFIYDTVCERYKIKIKDESIGKTFYLEGDELLIKDVKLNEKIHLILNGILKDNDKQYLKYDIDLISFLTDSNKHFTFSPFKPLVDYNVKGNISGKLEVHKNNALKGNLKLNDFSMFVAGVESKNNKADLIFKGTEVEINSSVHTSKKDSADLSGKFNYGKKKAIDLNVNANNVNLENLYKIISVISKSLNIPNKLDGIEIKGLLNANFAINSDFKKLKSKGNAQIINAQISHSELPYSVSKINSKVNFDNNKIIIEKAQAYVNSTPINISGEVNEDVSVNIKAESSNLDLKTLITLFLKNQNLPVNVLKGKVSFISDIQGKLNNSLKMNTTVLLNDFAFVEKTMKIPVSFSTVEMNIRNNKNLYSGEVLCSNLKTSYNKKSITADKFNINFDEKIIKIPSNVLKFMSSPVIISGNINNYLKTPSGIINFSGDILSENLASILSDYINQPHKAVGKIKTSGSINFLPESLKIKAFMHSDKNNYLSYLVIKELLNKASVLGVEAEMTKNSINIKDLYIKEDNQNIIEPRIKVSGLIENLKSAKFNNLHVSIPESITVRTNFLGGEETSLNADIIINNTISNPEIKGSAKVYQCSVNKFLTLIKNADLSFSKDNIRIIAPDVNINSSKLNVIADIEPKFGNTITVSNANLSSPYIDLNTLFPMIQKEQNPFGNNLLNIKKGTASINSFVTANLKARNISSSFSLKNNILKIDDIMANAYNGNIAGNMSYDFNHSNLTVKIIGKGLDIKESLFDLCQIEDNLSGKTDFTTSISFIPGDFNQVLKSLSGRVTFDAYNGKMGTLGKFEYYMHAQNLLYHGLLNATLNRIADAVSPQNTAKFKESHGSVLFQNGFLIAEQVKTIGPNMSLFLKGRTNLLTNQANIDIYGRISDEIKSKLGNFGDVSISELVNGQSAKKNVHIMSVPASIIENIPPLYKKENSRTNTFKVNICGNINSVSSINSFMWIVEKLGTTTVLPDFADINNENN